MPSSPTIVLQEMNKSRVEKKAIEHANETLEVWVMAATHTLTCSNLRRSAILESNGICSPAFTSLTWEPTPWANLTSNKSNTDTLAVGPDLQVFTRLKISGTPDRGEIKQVTGSILFVSVP
ncbi:hypothetical protein RRG08_024466 [Elysia crispata]|uniref:Uncharacterized protein n=1 Tax=Elysia crispata TaxID=231223 RepID=A0AAE0YQC3_9GAST|nr:hypothetical protein RRG08_024466 [Elysia crispata]